MNKEFAKVRTMTDKMISSLVLISGILLIVLPTAASVKTMGCFVIAVGILLLVILKTGWQDTETKERYGKKNLHFPKKDKAEILSALENHIDDIDMLDEGKGEGLRMDIYYNKHKAFINLSEFVPYNYEPISPTFEYPADRVRSLLN